MYIMHTYMKRIYLKKLYSPPLGIPRYPPLALGLLLPLVSPEVCETVLSRSYHQPPVSVTCAVPQLSARRMEALRDWALRAV